MSSFVDLLKSMLPLSEKNQRVIMYFSKFLGQNEIKTVKRAIKQRKLKVGSANLGISIAKDRQFYTLDIAAHAPEIISLTENVNKKSEEYVKQEIFREISATISELIPKFIAPKIVGLQQAKEAVWLQLFSNEQLNILLIGDPGTGKTEVIQACSEIAPISSFGLGSGMSGVGLTVTVKGKDVQKGILPLADKGIACIDELNLMKKEDMGGLYNAMEKGFVTYDKGGKHYRYDAKVSVLATANPRYAQFLGKTIEQLRKELPFDSALLTRFHLVFLVRKPDLKKFVEIAKGILGRKDNVTNDHDKEFIRDYISYAKKIEIEFPKELEQRVVVFAKGLKQDEKKFLIDVNPRLVVGIVRLAKASARQEMRAKVEEVDLKRAFNIFKKSLYGVAPQAKTI